jgi:hypothetical protein
MAHPVHRSRIIAGTGLAILGFFGGLAWNAFAPVVPSEVSVILFGVAIVVTTSSTGLMTGGSTVTVNASMS